MIDAFRLVCLEREVGCAAAKVPDFHGPIEAGRCEGVGVLRVDRKAHHIVAVTFKNLHAFPTFVPIPQFDRHVIAGREDKGLLRVNDNGANVIGMRFKRRDLFAGVVVVDSKLEVITATDNPILPRDESAGSNGDICELEGLDD